MLIDDNCRPHRAYLDLTYFSWKESRKKWSAYFLDMNQIEYVLDSLIDKFLVTYTLGELENGDSSSAGMGLVGWGRRF